MITLRKSLVILLLLAAALACRPAVSTPSPVANSKQASPDATVRGDLTPVPQTAPTGTPPAQQAAIDVQVMVTGLQVPWTMDFAPDGRAFVTERPGRIRIIENGQLQQEPWMTLTVAHVGEAGLLGLALDPQFSLNGFAYVAYTYRAQSGDLENRLVRLREDPATGKGTVDIVLLDGLAGGTNHDGGRVEFGPDGKLYWTMGDAFDRSLAQDMSSLNGKILRLNPDGTIPIDNPFPDSPIYSYGHRNPQGLAWQPNTGRLYQTEHGPSGEKGCCQDEVNLIEPGKNYGWPVISGDEMREGMETPILHSGNTVVWAPGGAAFLTKGPWAGAFLFAGLRGQALYKVTFDAVDPRKVLSFEQLLRGQFGRLRDVAEGPDGAVYVLTSNRDGRGASVPEDDRILRILVR